MSEFLDGVALFFRFARLFIRSKMQYRLNFYFLVVAVIFNYTVTVLGIWIVLSRFKVIHGWSAWEISFLFGLMITSYGMCVFSFIGIREFATLVQRGYLDKYLVRPRNILFQVMTTALEPAAIGHIALGLTLLVLASRNLGLIWTAARVTHLAVCVISAMLINMALLLVSAATCFWTVDGRDTLELIMTLNREFFVYPITIYDTWVQVVGTVILPVSFITFFPAQNFIGHKQSMFPSTFVAIAPLVGIAFFLAAYSLWHWTLRHYQGTGS